MIYLDNAATTGHKPESVVHAVSEAITVLSANPGRGGYETSQMASKKVYECRKKIAEMFGAYGPEKVVFTPNCTAALNYVIKGVLKPGDHTIVSCLEHNAVARPMHKMAQHGVKVDYAEVIFDDSEATVRSFERLILPETKLIVCTHASNVTGHILPIREIGELCRKKGILFAVDAAQTAGIVPINMQLMNIDYLCVAPHKGLYAPMGTGLLIANSDIPDTIIEGGTGTISASYFQPTDLPERMESGTLNLPGIAGIYSGAEFVNRRGIENIYKYEMLLAKKFYSGLKLIPGVTVYTPPPVMYQSVPTVSFNIIGLDSTTVANKLGDAGIAVRAGLHCAPMAHKRIGTLETGTVRICISVFNTEQDIRMTLMAIKKITFGRKNMLNKSVNMLK